MGRTFEYDLEKYLKTIKMLPSEEIRDLVAEYKKDNSKEKLNKIIEQNMKLIYQIASRYVYEIGVYDICDLVQEGVLGVIRAIELFEPDKGFMFSTYAYWWVEQRISRYTLKEKNYYSGSHHAMRKLNELRKLKIDKYINKENLSVEDIMKELNVTEASAKEFLNASLPIIHLNSVIKGKDERDRSEIYEMLEDKDNINPADDIEEKDFREYVINIMKKYLTDKEYDMMMKRYGFYGEPMTLQQIADDYGISRERVRQIENKAIKKLKYKREFKEEEFQHYKTNI